MSVLLVEVTAMMGFEITDRRRDSRLFLWEVSDVLFKNVKGTTTRALNLF